jgi:RimJ/RimL family protein N-acetyltransferase
MDHIAIAHPSFRPWLIEEAKRRSLIYKDQAFIAGQEGEYPEDLETYRTARTGLNMTLRPVKISDESLLKEFFYSLSDKSIYRRFISTRRDMHHERLQKYTVIDYTREMIILATVERDRMEVVVGICQYGMEEAAHAAEVGIVVRDDYQNKGVGTELLSYVTYLAKRSGLLGFTAEVLMDNQPMLHLFEKQGFVIEKRLEGGVYELKMAFGET